MTIELISHIIFYLVFGIINELERQARERMKKQVF